MTDREPICGFCWAKGERHPVVFDPLVGCWVCPVCGAQAITDCEAEQDIRRALGKDPGQNLLLDNPFFYRDPTARPQVVGLSVGRDVIDSALRSKKGRSRPAGRRRKKPQRRSRGPTLEQDAEMVRRHNLRMADEARRDEE